MLEGNDNRFFIEIYSATDNSGMKFVKFFQQPNTSTAMNGWNIKTHFTDFFIFEV